MTMKCLFLSVVLVGALLSNLLEQGNAQCTDDEFPLLWYPFDTTLDSVGCEPAVSTVVGSVTIAPVLGGSAYFNGKSRLEVPFATGLFSDNNVDKFTVALWFLSFGLESPVAGLVGNGNCPGSTYFSTFGLYIDDQGTSGGMFQTGAYSWVGGALVNRWEWTHIAEVYDGPNVLLYVNGELQTSTANGQGSIRSSGCPMVMGQIGQIGINYFQGLLDDVRVYTRALDAGEIKWVMDQQPKEIN